MVRICARYVSKQIVESYIQISWLNDFMFCPRSIYFHNLYGQSTTRNYHSSDQIKGLNAHKTIDSETYTTTKKILQGIEVYSEKYNICGRIDTFDTKENLLTERKKKIKVIYDGFIFQLYAQYFCLIEMGYKVDKIKLYSMDDNKNYPIDLPRDNSKMLESFEKVVSDLKNFDLNKNFQANAKKCNRCIYHNLCDYSLSGH